MYVVASFDHNLYLEMAISALEQGKIPRGHILAIPLDKRREERQLFDTIHRSDGFSMLDIAAVLGTCGMLLGAIYGFALTWGPILWGIIGLLAGAIIGLIWKWLLVKSRIRVSKQRRDTEVFLMIYCDETVAEWVEKTLWENTAMGVATFGADWHQGAGVTRGASLIVKSN